MAYLGAAGCRLAIITIETALGPTVGNLRWEGERKARGEGRREESGGRQRTGQLFLYGLSCEMERGAGERLNGDDSCS